MNQFNTAPLFPEALVFPDVDPDTLAKEETGYRTARSTRQAQMRDQGHDQGPWHEYLRKFLPEMSRQRDARAS